MLPDPRVPRYTCLASLSKSGFQKHDPAGKVRQPSRSSNLLDIESQALRRKKERQRQRKKDLKLSVAILEWQTTPSQKEGFLLPAHLKETKEIRYPDQHIFMALDLAPNKSRLSLTHWKFTSSGCFSPWTVSHPISPIGSIPRGRSPADASTQADYSIMTVLVYCPCLRIFPFFFSIECKTMTAIAWRGGRGQTSETNEVRLSLKLNSWLYYLFTALSLLSHLRNVNTNIYLVLLLLQKTKYVKSLVRTSSSVTESYCSPLK